MSRINKLIERTCEVEPSVRLLQMRGMFDIESQVASDESWTVDFNLPDDWNIGVIVGPSGCGKTTIARELFSEAISNLQSWPDNQCLLDGFPNELGIKEIIELLSSIGFSSPPSWMRPFRVLSNGEQFRASMARTLAEMKELAVIDEFSSVVDRNVAQICSSAIQKCVRRRNQKFIAVSCHYDILDWLEPDWVYQPHTNEFQRGRHLWRRPKIEINIRRVHSTAWKFFRKHHYLDSNLNNAAECFVAFIQDVPVAFSAWLNFPMKTREPCKREHRTVVLPDYQGISIGNRLSDFLSAIYKDSGFRVFSTTSHPAMIRRRTASKDWRTIIEASLRPPESSVSIRPTMKHATTRLTTSFEFIGASIKAKSLSTQLTMSL